jgi:hypothetical protein
MTWFCIHHSRRNNGSRRYRYCSRKIYTAAGSDVLLTVNPYEVLTDPDGVCIYSSAYVDKYKAVSLFLKNSTFCGGVQSI